MIKKSLDIISLAAIAILAMIGIRLAIWGEPPRVPGQMPIEVGIIVLDTLPTAFGVIWLIVRYANVAVARYPYLLGFSPGRPPRLFYFMNAAFAAWLIWNVVKGVWQGVEQVW